MIVCKYQELKTYDAVLPCLENALACVEKLREKGFPAGKHEYEDGFVVVLRGVTEPFDKTLYETHRKYLDVHYIVEGEETAYYEPMSALTCCKEYDEDGDIAFFASQDGSGSKIHAGPGMCWVAYPEDAHMPCRYTGTPSEYLKLVIKLPRI